MSSRYSLVWACTREPARGVSRLRLALTALAATMVGALIERYQFFVASVAPRMPGGFRR
jgi:hypothetical protein